MPRPHLFVLFLLLALSGCPNTGTLTDDDDDDATTDDDDTAQPDDDDATGDDDDATADDDDDATSNDDDATSDDDDATGDDDDATSDDDDATGDDDDSAADDDDATGDDDDSAADDDDATTDDDDATADDDDASGDDDDATGDDDDATGDDDDATSDDDDATANADPEAADDAFDVIGNVPLAVDAAVGLLDNDDDVDLDSLEVETTASPLTTTLGGTVTLSANGSFGYAPPTDLDVGDIDSFTYTVLDGEGGSDTATVTLTVTHVVWFVDNSASAGDGSMLAPFDLLADAEAASIAGEIIYVYEGDGTTSGMDDGITLDDGQSLIGAGVALVVGSTQLLPAGNDPSITNSAGSAVVADGSATIAGLNIPAPDGHGIEASSPGAAIVIHDVTVMDFTTNGVDVGGVDSLSVADSTLTGGDEGVRLVGPFTSLSVTGSTIGPGTGGYDFIKVIDDSVSTSVTVTLTGNTLQGDVTDLSNNDDGIDINLDGDGSGNGTASVIITGNLLDAIDSDGLELDFDEDLGATSAASVHIEGNTFTDIGSDGIDTDCWTDTVCVITVHDNVLDALEDFTSVDLEPDAAIEFRAEDDADATFIATSNTVTDWAMGITLDASTNDSSGAPTVLMTGSNNNASDLADQGLFWNAAGEATVTGTLTGDSFTADYDALVVEAGEDSEVTLAFTGLTLSSVIESGLQLDAYDDSTINATLTSCNSSGAHATVFNRWENGTVRLSAVGNDASPSWELENGFPGGALQLGGTLGVGYTFSSDDNGNLAATGNLSNAGPPIVTAIGDITIVDPATVPTP